MNQRLFSVSNEFFVERPSKRPRIDQNDLIKVENYRTAKQLDAEDNTLQALLESLMFAVSVEKLKEQTSKYFEDVVYHFAILAAIGAKDENKKRMLRSFYKACLNVMSAENKNLSKIALRAMDLFTESRMAVLNMNSDKPENNQFNEDLFDYVNLLEHTATQDWLHKQGVSLAINQFCNAPIPLYIKKQFQLQFLKMTIAILEVCDLQKNLFFYSFLTFQKKKNERTIHLRFQLLGSRRLLPAFNPFLSSLVIFLIRWTILTKSNSERLFACSSPSWQAVVQLYVSSRGKLWNSFPNKLLHPSDNWLSHTRTTC